MVNEIKEYFIAKFREREQMSKGLSNYIAAFDYFDKALIALSTTSGVVSIALLASVIGAPVRIGSGSFSFAFSLTIGIIKNY